jgi:hypothetical protein
MDKKKKNTNGYPPYDDDKFYDIAKTASANDCTGLMPTPPKDEAAAESYADLSDIPQVKGKVNNGLQEIRKTKNNEDVTPEKRQ